MVKIRSWRLRALLTAACVAVIAVFVIVRTHAANSPSTIPLKLRSGDRFLTAVDSETFLKSAGATRGGVIQFESIPSDADREALKSLGVVFGTYLPENAYIASIPGNVSASLLSSYGVKWAGALSDADKIAEALTASVTTPQWCLDSTGVPRFSVGLFPHLDLKDAEQWMTSEFGARIIGTSKLRHSIEVALPADNWQDVAHDDRVVWLEPFWPRVENNNSNRANTGADIVQAAPYGLTGLNVTVGEWDGGRADPSHPDFGGRVISADASGIMSHATHVAGTVLGSGLNSGGTYKGMAPQAIIWSQQWFFSSSEMESEYADAISNVDMRISTNSWSLGTGTPSVPNCNALMGNYLSECASIDDACRGDLGAPVTIVWSAGNERSTSSQYCGSLGFTFGTLMPYSTSKNILTIGAINSNNSSMTSFSSWGPTDDGRVKPELVAPGCQSNDDFGVKSTVPGGGYAVMCGTSMSAPTVAGCAALFMQRWMTTHLDPPFASSVKAAFVESADDLGDPGPEYDWGYGRLNIVSAVDLLNQNRIIEDSISTGQTRTWTFTSNGSLPKVSVTLAWDDPGAAENAAVTLINNLNLRLLPPSGPAEYLPWALNPASPSSSATTGVNNRDNLEQVRRTSGIQVGTWTVEVTGPTVPVGPQRFSLAFASGMTLTSSNQPYAVSIQAASNPSAPPGTVNLPFNLTNAGLNNDSYDVTLTSSHGWSIASNPRTIALSNGADSSLSFSMTIPPATPIGTVDSVAGFAQSQGSPSTTSTNVMLVTVTSGHSISVASANDTVGVPGRTINVTSRLYNTGLYDETIDWSADSDFPWTIAPSSGSTAVPMGGFVDVVCAVTIPGNIAPGLVNNISIGASSVDDPSAVGADQTAIKVFARPPAPVLINLADNALTGINTPALNWTHSIYTQPPPGFTDFSYYVDVSEYPVPVSPIRYGPVPDTFFTLPALADGQYQWKITTLNPVGDTGLPSPTRHFTIDTQAPSSPTLDQPGDSLYDSDTTVAFSWQPAVGAAQYKFEKANDPAFTTGLDTAWTATTSQNRVLVSCSTVVYWRVKSMDAAGNVSAPSAANLYRVYQVGDVNFDCILNIVDVVGMIGVAFRNNPLPDPPGRAEMLCHPPTDITDVVRLIDVVFRAGAPPCGPS